MLLLYLRIHFNFHFHFLGKEQGSSNPVLGFAERAAFDEPFLKGPPNRPPSKEFHFFCVSPARISLVEVRKFCKATCSVPSTTGYNFASAGGTVTQSGFSPSGVTCTTGYSGTVTYTQCSSAGAAYSVSGCEATTV